MLRSSESKLPIPKKKIELAHLAYIKSNEHISFSPPKIEVAKPLIEDALDTSPQYDPSGKKIQRRIKNLDKRRLNLIKSARIEFSDSTTQEIGDELREAADKLGRSTYSYQSNRARAKKLSSDWKDKRIGLLYSNRKCDQERVHEIISSDLILARTNLIVNYGAGGSRKSSNVQAILKEYPNAPNSFTVITPTRRLRDEWVDAIQPEESFMVKTFESPFYQSCSEIVIIDEIGKLPAGYLDCLIRYHSHIKLIIILGDTRQTVFFAENPDASILTSTHEVDYLNCYSDFYLNETYRNPRNIANALGVWSHNSYNGAINLAKSLDSRSPIVTPARRSVSALTDAGRQVITYAGSQGLTFKTNYQINLTMDTPICDERTIYTVLSRAQGNITFVNAYSYDEAFQKKLNCTPWLKTFFSMINEVPRETPELNSKPKKITVKEVPVKTHLPIEVTDTIYESWADEVSDKESREMFNEEFGHTNTVQGDTLATQAIAVHQAKDNALYEETLKLRISTSTIEANEQALKDTKDLGQALFEAYKKRMNLPENPYEFNLELWQQCSTEFEKNYLSKSENLIKNGELRQSPDTLLNQIGLFIKSQAILKIEKFCKNENKPGQSIAAFHQQTIAITGTMSRYVRKIRLESQPDNIFINSEKTPEQLKEFLENHWNFEQISHANDYTAFDKSQDGSALNFELIYYQFMGVPTEILNFYRYLKLHAKIYKGVLAIFRLTGEGPTFDANTDVNIAFDSLQYKIPKDVAAVYGGDDMARNCVVAQNINWPTYEKRLALKAKPEFGMNLTFCGWRFTKYGLIKDPFKMHFSIRYHEAKGNLDNVLESYFLDFIRNYELGDHLFEVYSSNDMAFHQELVRKFILKGFNFPKDR